MLRMKTNNIKVYLVGGAVRDMVLGRTQKDHDFVVVGATRGYMEGLGFDQVGADFPVFLHPKSKDEFALARTERKTAPGYGGFECDFNIDVTLEDDLVRRDLTMNSMAIEVNADILVSGEIKIIGEIIDPYCGSTDAEAGVLRHTSEAFAEDPLRVLRTARFAARYKFVIADETVKLMQEIVCAGEMDALPMERVFVEFQKAMMEDHPQRFFDYLNITDALELYFDELCSWNGTALKFAINLNASFEERVAALFLDVEYVDAERMLTDLKAPNHLIDTVLWSCNLETIICETSGPFFDVENLTEALWESLNNTNAWKNVEKLQRVAYVHLYEGEEGTFEAIQRIMTAVIAGAEIGFDNLEAQQRDVLSGKAIGEAISIKRLEVLEELNLFPS